MKKMFLSVMFVSAFLCFANTESTQVQIDVYNRIDKEFDLGKRCLRYTEIGAVSKRDNIVIIKTWSDNYYIKKIDLDNIDKDMYGYCFFEYNKRKYLAIYGSNMFFSFDYLSPNISNAYEPGLSIKEAPFAFMQYIKPNDFESFLKKVTRYKRDALESWNAIPQFSIKKIEASPWYNEPTKSGIVSYRPDYLNMIFHEEAFLTNFLLRNPWVPGKEKDAAGIGESLTIEFAEPKDNIVVLNGYVDLEKRYLYKANNRVKTAVIASLDEGNPFEFEYRFEDFVHFAEIDFPAKVSKVSFTIKDVYNGEKLNDTCVTAVITRRD
ncbi:hypothetical protein HMPREF0860_0905 [Treponema socranskii subsp. socranskii VPI DR56BR1116 = ATCC 35536]|uniref:NAD glycohydrolase translocation F5/8 type C domain-containing protein n=1 Tax=Treponema socranskii subsp. socranskii VPI DR56BR1116 = ATCC 35536 TaxID=1125725 RepID=A0ABN0P3R6_TRESO|nr:hypothetical protein [Treponema socranskii]ERK01214.1 hypothetical protein HMPREF0860_0905 [Treponema socranskii subsp. socranskii VPI DR56BR1116 = ATCC 35536]